MTGIELLQMIKNGELKEGTKVNVIKLDERFNVYDYSIVTTITFIHNNLEWPSGTFRSSMLWDNDYLFEIVESKEVPNKIEEINFVDEFSDSYYDTCLIKTKDKVNELIDAVNYLLDTQHKG